MFVVLWVAVSWVAGVLVQATTGQPLLVNLLAYSPWLAAQGELWRIASWPLANSLSMWAVLNLFFFYTFGSEVEQQLGRQRMAKLLAGMWLALTLTSTAVGLLMHANAWLVGIGQVQFLLFLLWIADNPRRPFFFNIPAWVVGAVIVAVQVLQMLGARDASGVVELLVGAALVAVLGRRFGMLDDYPWIPGRTSPRPARQQRAARRQHEQKAADAARLDQLLDKIGQGGMDSLSPAERRELMRLRNRR